MPIRIVMTTWLAVLVACAAMIRPASAQELRPDRSSESSPSGFNLTNQPLFDIGDPQSTASQRRARDPETGFGFGIKGGPLFSTFNQEGANVSFENKTGYLVGIWFGGNRPGLVGVMGEVMYAKKGSRSAGIDTNLTYLEIPILLRVNVGTQSINKWVVYGIVGPVFDIKLKADVNGVDVGEQYSGFQFGVVAGAGVEIFRFLVEGRGNWGLRNVRGGDIGNAQEIRDRSFAVLFGVRIT